MFRELSDKQLRQAWAHMSTERIRQMGFVRHGKDAERINAGRRRIIALREQDEADGNQGS